jgi:branched-chain amino acid transport system permease protein
MSQRSWRLVADLDWRFTMLLLSNGVLIGLMYSLIAIGFVLVYKATDAINFAQGEFVMIAGFVAAAGLMVWGAPLWVAVGLTIASLVAFGFVLERVMLRKLIGRPVIAVVMATIGLASILRGLGPFTIFSGTKPLPLPIREEPFMLGPLFIPPIQLLGAAVSLGFLAAFGWFFLKSRKGIAMRAVADNQQVAMAVGINVERYFGVAWAMTGIVSALGGILWGNMLGVDVNLALVGFKVFPVVILGGLDSIPGAIIGGLIVGVVENVAAGYIDPVVGGGTKDFAPYVLMIAALMVRPYGIFGKRIIERI